MELDVGTIQSLIVLYKKIGANLESYTIQLNCMTNEEIGSYYMSKNLVSIF